MAECNAAKTLDNAVLEGHDTDVQDFTHIVKQYR